VSCRSAWLARFFLGGAAPGAGAAGFAEAARRSRGSGTRATRAKARSTAAIMTGASAGS
jgi:hypothetical protein